MPTYAITGAAGYLGSRMTRHLLETDAEARVIGIDVRPARHSDPRLEHHLLDVRSPRLGELLRERGVDVVLHFAFVVDPFYDEAAMHDIDVGGTKNVLAAVRAAGVGHLVATSSTTAYGALADNRVPLLETDPVRAAPSYAYAHDKRLMDELLSEFAAAHPDVTVCTIRPCIVLGPTVANYIVYTLLGPPFATLVDGADPLIQFVHEDDVVRLVALCVARRAAGAWNAVGSGMLTLREVAALRRRPALPVPGWLAHGLTSTVHRFRLLPFALPPGVLDFFRHPWVASGEKARRELGFEPTYTSRQCLEIVLADQKSIFAEFERRMRARGRL
jgi:UDP-glucose 4-epimerase